MCLVRMIEADDYVHIVSEAFFDSSDKVLDILSWVENVYHILLVDKHNSFFFFFIKTDISDMVFYEFSPILIPYFLQKELDVFIHREIDYWIFAQS